MLFFIGLKTICDAPQSTARKCTELEILQIDRFNTDFVMVRINSNNSDAFCVNVFKKILKKNLMISANLLIDFM